ncbi:MAG: hypothetical protein M9899_04085 [Bdellovibrionaceae bacterium]|nr:hypothetical protein [Pseudobdellovibrionaceae bacterium]
MLKTDTMTVQKPEETPSDSFLEIPWCTTFHSRPVLTWKDLALCHSSLNSSASAFTEIAEDAIYSVLAEMYPEKGLFDLFDLVLFMKEHRGLSFDPSHLAKAYGFFWNDSYDQLLLRYVEFPITFQNWGKAKGFRLNDARPLNLLSTDDIKQEFWTLALSSFEARKVSHAEGKTLLELLVDLYLLHQDEDSILRLGDEAKDNESWISRLRKKRYPMTENIDQTYRAFIDKKRWSLPCQFKRQGDKKGFVLSAFIASENEITKVDQQIKQSLEHLKEFYQGTSHEQ